MRKLFIGIICSFLITVSVFAASDTTYGPTTADDTLWHIASELRPNNDVSVQQVMLAIFCYNEGAFYTNNINSLEPGKIIKLPSLDKICSLSRDQAYFEVEKQDRQWKNSRLKHPKHLIKHKKSAKKAKKATTTDYEQSESPSTETTPSEQAAQQLTETVTQTTQQSTETAPEAIPPEQAEQALATAAPQVPETPVSNETTAIASAQTQEMAPVALASAATTDGNNIVQTQMAQVNEKINSIEQNVEQLKKAVLGSKNCSWDSVSGCFKPILQYIDGLAARLGQPLFTILFVCVIVLLLTILFCLSGYRRKKQDASKFLSPNVSSTEEDNFMAGKEGHAAKLNLARAYIDMGKETEAHVMLDEVLAKGSPSEQEKAKMLLAEIKKL